MDLRRAGEFAFGIGVFMCGAAFLLLAVERLNAPVFRAMPVAPPIVAASVAPIVVARHPKVRKSAAVIVAAAPAAAIVRPQPAPPQPRHTRQPNQAKIAIVYRPAAKRSPMPRILAVANVVHRPHIALERRPKNERTPEPPIGYDDRPALVSADDPNAAMPTMAPVQVELTTKNLGR